MPNDRLLLHTSLDARRLLDAAADGFLKPPRSSPAAPFPTVPYLLALRQGGLRDDLYVRARSLGVSGWFEPPLCLFGELSRWFGTTAARPLDELERHLVLGQLLQAADLQVLRRSRHDTGLVRALDRLIGELAVEGVSPDAFAAALASVTDRDEFQCRRDAELAAVYRRYRERLAQHGARDGRDELLDFAAAIRADSNALAERLGGRREIRFVGLQDLRNGWRPLLQALLESPAIDRVAIFTSVQLELDALDPIRVTDSTGSSHGIASRLFGAADGAHAPDGGGEAISIISAPDRDRELEEVAVRVRALIDAGVPRSQIAIVAREARPAVDLAADALARAGVPADVRRRVGLGDVPIIRALLALLQAAGEGWTRHGLIEIADQPYLRTGIPARIVNAIGFTTRVTGLDGWLRALDALHTEAQAVANGDRDDDRGRRTLPALAEIDTARRGLADFAALATALDGEHPVGAWVRWLERFLRDDPWGMRAALYAVPEADVSIVRPDLKGWDALRQTAADWAQALGTWGEDTEPVNAAAFRARLESLLDGDVILQDDATDGVAVLESFAAAYRHFDHLFVVGLEDGAFPLLAPRSPLLSDREHQPLATCGMPLELRSVWEARERELFRVVVAGGRHLTLSFARQDTTGAETIRSLFIDAIQDVVGTQELVIPNSRVVTPGIRLAENAGALSTAARGAHVELQRRDGSLSPWNGLISSPALRDTLASRFGDTYLWSPTQLESYAKCPWSFFSSRVLGLTKLEDPDDDLDTRVRGTLLHGALERFVRRLPAGSRLGADNLDALAPLMDAALDDALAAHEGEWTGHPSLLLVRMEELRRLLHEYLQFEAEHNDKSRNNRSPRAKSILMGTHDVEYAFTGVQLERHGARIRFRGFVDRIDISVDPRTDGRAFVSAIDYKSTEYSTPGAGKKPAWADGVVLQVPLYAHALRERLGMEVAAVEYRALKKPKPVHALQLWKFATRDGDLVEDAADRERMDAALDAAVAHVERLRRGEFPAEPPASCNCPSFCHAIDICRIAGGPRLGGYA